MTWPQFEEMLLKFGGWLVQPEQTVPAVAQHCDAGELTPEEERWADEWVRKFYLKPDLSPLTPRQRYVLVPRFRYAALEVHIWGRFLPTEPVPDPKSKWEELLVTRWHDKFRALWLQELRTPGDDQGSLTA